MTSNRRMIIVFGMLAILITTTLILGIQTTILAADRFSEKAMQSGGLIVLEMTRPEVGFLQRITKEVYSFITAEETVSASFAMHRAGVLRASFTPC